MRQRPALGAVLMILGMLTFPFGDAVVKYLSADYSAVGLTWVRFAVGALILVPLSVVVAGKVKIDRRMIVEQSVRAVLVVAATLLFLISVTLVPLADAIGAYLIGPLVASALAYFLLGEPFSVKRGLAVLIGFIGAMIIVRPSVSMEVGYLYALGAGVCYGAFLVASRACIRPIHPFIAVAYQTLTGAILLAPFGASILWKAQIDHVGLFFLAGFGSAIANVLVVIAISMASAALIAPLVYVEIIGATVLGYFIFDDIPSTSTAVGMSIIVFAGLILIDRRRKKSN